MMSIIHQELAGLLDDTSCLLNCPEPALGAWEAYTQRRNDLFCRMQAMALEPDSLDKDAFGDLLAAVLERDRLLTHKIRRQLSKFRQEIAGVRKKRQALKAYGAISAPARSPHRATV
jgi:hypothetical protein